MQTNNTDRILKIEYHPLDGLIPYKKNARTHSIKQIKQIAKSISEFGFTNPILVDQNQNIIAGHGRALAAKELGLPTVPTICLEHMNAAQKRAYIIADNKLAENAGWDEELLKLELGDLINLNFDVGLIGFEVGEIDTLIFNDPAYQEVEEIPDLPDTPISQLGDLWLLGSHRLLCGNSLDKSSYVKVLDGQKADMVFTDPPYNVKINGHVSGKGSIKHEEFAMASGEMTQAEFSNFLKDTFSHLIEFSMNGSIHFICMDWRHLHELLSAGSLYKELKNMCVWDKTTGGMGSLYRSQHELVFVYKNGSAPHINNVELGKNGRNRTNVWHYPGANSFKNLNKAEELKMHPTVKPVAMIIDAIKDCSKHKSLILDCFAGSGSTLIAAEKCNRQAALIELDPRYIDVTIERFFKETGIKAIHVESGMTFQERKSYQKEEM